MRRHITFGRSQLALLRATYIFMRRCITNGIHFIDKTRFTDPGKFADRNYPIGALRSQPISDEHATHTVGLVRNGLISLFFCRFYDNHMSAFVYCIFEWKLFDYRPHDRHWKHWEILLYQSRADSWHEISLSVGIFINITWQSYPLFTRKSYLMKNDTFFHIRDRLAA